MLRDAKFRQALNWAVDREKIVDLVWGGTTTAGHDHHPARTTTHDPDWHWEPPADVKYTYDPAMAKQKLDEAGYKDTDGDGIREYKGKPIELRPDRPRGVGAEPAGRASSSPAGSGDVGIKVKLEVMDEATLGDRELNYEGDMFTPDFDMFLWGWYLDYDPGSMLSYFTKGQIENWNETCWSDPEYEQLYKQQGAGARPGQAQGDHRPHAADPLRADALHRDRLRARLRGVQHRQVGGLHRRSRTRTATRSCRRSATAATPTS